MYIGIDLGGTNIAVGLVSDEGKIIAKDSTPTLKEREYTEIVKDMAVLCENICKSAGYTMKDVEAIGMGCPGSIDSENGVVVYANNLKMDRTPIAEELRKYFDKPVRIENDANAAAYGEYIINGNNASSFVFVTLGTGVGGGIILDGKIYTGFNGTGAELGHTPLVYKGYPCSCGRLGCYESYASVTALIRQTKEAMEKNPDSIMNEMAAKEGKVSGRTSFECAKKGDKAAQEVVDQYLEYVGEGLVGIVNTFQPERILIGGGISREGNYLLGPVKNYVNHYDYNRYMPKVEIGIATLFNDAGIIGAAFAAKNMI